MPQLEQIDTYSAQIFWLFVCFGMVYLFLSAFVVPRLGGIIKTRDNTITSNVSAAEEFKNSAVKFGVEFEQKSAVSKSDAVGIISSGSLKANSLYDKGILDTELDLKKHIESSEKQINLAKDHAVAELNKNINNFVEEIIKKVAELNGDKIIIEKIVSKLNS